MSRIVLSLSLTALALAIYLIASAAPATAAPDLFDCDQLPSQAAAQTLLRADPTDPHQLDNDHDGIACEGEAPCPCDMTSIVYNNGTGIYAYYGGLGADRIIVRHNTAFNNTNNGISAYYGALVTENTTYGQTGCAYMDLQNTVTHEAGHFIGLAHTQVSGATMNATTAPREVSKRDLASDDLAGVCAVYPHASGGCGCGAGGAFGAASLLLALLALRPRRR